MGASRPPRKLLELWWPKGSRDPEKKGAARKFSPLARPRPVQVSTGGRRDFRLAVSTKEGFDGTCSCSRVRRRRLGPDPAAEAGSRKRGPAGGPARNRVRPAVRRRRAEVGRDRVLR